MKPTFGSEARADLRRFVRLARGELGFAARYGILPLYALITGIYLALLSAVAPSARPAASGVILLTDPAAMGLFFMGALVLLEKSQRVHCALAAAPVREGEYIAAKALAMLCGGLPAGLIVGAFSGLPFWSTALSLTLASVLFSLLGLWLACESESLNRFLLLTIPVELVVFVPALFYWYGGLSSPLWIANPGVAAILLFSDSTALRTAAVASLLLWTVLAYRICHRAVVRYFARLGGGRL